MGHAALGDRPDAPLGRRHDGAGVDGILSLHRNVACLDTISRVRTDSGGTGFCDFETTHNSRNGADPVPSMIGAVTSDGLSLR